MTQTRQIRRREQFLAAFTAMPVWETWTEKQQVDTGFRDTDGKRIVQTVERGNFRLIGRRKRRQMARIASKRLNRN